MQVEPTTKTESFVEPYWFITSFEACLIFNYKFYLGKAIAPGVATITDPMLPESE